MNNLTDVMGKRNVLVDKTYWLLYCRYV